MRLNAPSKFSRQLPAEVASQVPAVALFSFWFQEFDTIPGLL